MVAQQLILPTLSSCVIYAKKFTSITRPEKYAYLTQKFIIQVLNLFMAIRDFNVAVEYTSIYRKHHDTIFFDKKVTYARDHRPETKKTNFLAYFRTSNLHAYHIPMSLGSLFNVIILEILP